jgi:hypothetical protein
LWIVIIAALLQGRRGVVLAGARWACGTQPAWGLGHRPAVYLKRM